MTLRVFEAFSGIGCQHMALDNLGIEHEVVAIAEIDKYAIKSYTAIHGDALNLGDISQIRPEDIPDHDLFTYSFPCQDISISGKQGGLDVDSGTRSGLLWECQKVIAAKKPKYLLLENVKNLVGKRHKANFDLWLDWLVEQGYSNYWQVLNAKDYGIPQNRERVFVVSILGEHQPYEFPDKQPLKIRLADLLEPAVDEKFYLDNEKTRNLLAVIEYKPTVEIRLNQVGNFEKLANPDKKFNDPQVGRVLDTMGICQALDTMQGGNRQPKILIKNATTQGYLEATEGDDIDLSFPNSNTRRGRVQQKCRTTLQTGVSVGTVEFTDQAEFRIRKLTPLECWRVMGISDEAFYAAQAVNSNSQLYKQAGNGIVVPVLEAIFSKLFKPAPSIQYSYTFSQQKLKEETV